MSMRAADDAQGPAELRATREHEGAVRILIAEDSPTQAEKLRYILQRHGYEVAAAGNGVTALALLAENKPDLVLSDIVMPEMDGYELCRRIRATAGLADLPVVLLTSLAETADVLEGLACGADSFITKPYSENYLLAQVAQMLSDNRRTGGAGSTINVEVVLSGKKRIITTDQKRLVTLLISTYEAAVRRNSELTRTQDELSLLNERLEDLVAERTFALSSEIAVRSQTEVRLRESEARYRALFENTVDAVLLTDPDGSILSANPAAYAMFGWTEEEMRALGHAALLDAGDPRLPKLLEERARTGRATGELSFVRKDGSPFPGEVASLLFKDAAGAERTSLIIRDITGRLREAQEKARLEDQLRQTQKVEAIGSLAGGIAHDFNNLTSIVLGYGEQLLGQLSPGDPARRSVEQIIAAGRRSAALTRQLLAFSRKQTLQPEVLDLNALLRNLDTMLGRIIGENIELDVRLAADPGRVVADPGQLEQVVTNLVVNARDAMPGGGRLTVETAGVDLDEGFARDHAGVVPGPYVLLAISDNGSGMDEATMARLFEPFFTTKPKGKGTGLGLATASGIVKQSGGHISVSSVPGAGTTFRIYLPRTAALPEATVAETAGGAPRGRGERILLVDDEAPLREMCAAMLSGLGYRVSAAGSGQEALQLVMEQGLEPDLVVTDVVMPGMSGAELAQRLREHRAELNVLYMSGYPDDAIAPHGVLDPGTQFIPKPFTERALAVKVQEALAVRETAARPGRRVLMIDDDEQFRELMEIFCAKGGHVFAGVDSAAAALAALAAQPFDVLLVDVNIPGTSGELVLREIRAAGCVAPAIMLTADAEAVDLELLRPLGVVASLQKSSSAEPLLRAIESAGARP